MANDPRYASSFSKLTFLESRFDGTSDPPTALATLDKLLEIRFVAAPTSPGCSGSVGLIAGDLIELTRDKATLGSRAAS